eukprot:scaffold2068_cov96-Cylindrotheca_fusiformis.AAC.12
MATSNDNYSKEMKPPKAQRMNSKMIVLAVLVVLVVIHTWFNSDSEAKKSMLRAQTNAKTESDRHARNPGNIQNYIAVIDAGSSGSRVHVYQFTYDTDRKIEGSKYSPKIVQPDHETKKYHPGLSSFASHPQDAGASLEPLIAFAKEHIPIHKVQTTPILLKATAGLRLLQNDQPEVVESILDSVRTTLGQSGFRFSPSDATIISGQEEGMLGWLALNYLHEIQTAKKNDHLRGSQHNNNNKSPPKMWSVLEMGGASAQVSVPLDPSSTRDVPDRYVLSYTSPTSGDKGSMYTHSFLGYGVQSAKDAVEKALFDNEPEGEKVDVLRHPCLPDGFTEQMDPLHDHATTIAGTGDYEACHAIIQQAVFATKNGGECQSAKCFWNGDPSPNLTAKHQFWAFENFFYSMSGVGEIAQDASNREFQIKDYARVAKKMCATEWDVTEEEYPKDSQPKEYNKDWCFSALYAYSFFTSGLGLQDDQSLMVGNRVDNVGVDWALGAVLEHHPHDQR